MSIFDMFASKPAAAPQQATPTQPGNLPTPTLVPEQGQGVVPVQPETAPTPLDKFSKLWEDAPKPAQNLANQASAANLMHDDVAKAFGSADFSKSVTPEMLQAIAGGGEPAAAAFLQAMNTVAQQSMAQATLVATKLSERKIQEAIDAASSKVPDLLRSQSVKDHLQETNPLFSNPAVKPVIEATQAQLLEQYPNATKSEIAKMTNEYIVAMGAAFAPPPPTDPRQPKEEDWSLYLP